MTSARRPLANRNYQARNPECHRACPLEACTRRLLRAGISSTHLVFRLVDFFADVAKRIGE